MTAAKVEEVIPKYHEHVDAAVEQSENIQAAAKLLEKWARKDPGLRNYLLEPWLPRACYGAVTQRQRSNRRTIWTAANYTKGGHGARVLQHAKGLMDFPLPNGTKLCDAAKSDLDEAIKFYREQSDDMAAKANWFERIASKIGKRKVKDVLSEDELRDLKK